MRQGTLASTKQLKRKKAIFKLLACLFAFFLIVAAAIIGVFQIKCLKIQHIEINTANGALKEEAGRQINSFLSGKKYGFLPQNRIFYMPDEQWMADEIIFKIPKIKTVEIEKNFPDKLIINVGERKPIALLCGKGLEKEECFFIDETGFAFESAPSFSPGVFLKFFDQRSDEERRKEAKPSIEKISKLLFFSKNAESYLDIEKVVIKKEDVCELYSAHGPYLILDAKDDWSLAYSRFLTFWEQVVGKQKQELEYIDLRFGNKIFFKKQ